MNTELRDHLIGMLKKWAGDVASRTRFAHLYAFGSLFYSGGEQFSEDSSDIDVVAVFSPESSSATERVSDCLSLVPLLEELEYSLLHTLRRGEAGKPIVSVVAITPTEWEHGIHKDGKAAFFTTNEFYRLDENGGANFKVQSEAPYDKRWELILPAIQETQKFRNLFLRVSANRARQVGVWDSAGDPLPKPLVRAAAQARHFIEGKTDDTRYDVNLGLAFLATLLYGKSDENPSLRELNKWLIARQGGRGRRSGLKPEAHLLLWETLFDAVIKYLEDGPPKPIGSSDSDNQSVPEPNAVIAATENRRGFNETSRKSTDGLNKSKETARNALRSRLDSLTSDYQAASRQLEGALGEVDRNRLTRQVKSLWTEIEQLEKEIAKIN